MSMRMKLDAIEVEFTMEEIGFDVVLSQADKVVAFRGGLSVVAQMQGADAPQWAVSASTGESFTARGDVDGLTDWLVSLLERCPAPEPLAFYDGELVFRLEPVRPLALAA